MAVCFLKLLNQLTDFHEFSANVTQLEATETSYLFFPLIGNANMAYARICEVGATLAPFNIRSCNEAW